MSKTPLPQKGGSYTRDDKGALKKVEGTAPPKPTATPKPAPARKEKS